jgi:outer membrane protein OmpA-like peptidoglycan-associated protein
MHRVIRWAVAVALVALPLAAQQRNIPDLTQAQQVLVLADGAGAQIYAKSLYDDAAYRIRFAQENMSSPKGSTQEQARMRAREALFAARAALAKARWLSTNAAVRNLQSDINRFGGRSDVALREEDPSIDFRRGSTTKERIATAQAAIDQARAAGAEQTVPDNDLKAAQDNVESARKVSLGGRENSDVADHLAYVAEMMARRAYYMTRFAESSRLVPELQLQRTRLAQTSSEQQATTERIQREEAERRAAELQRQLTSQEASRQAQSAELQRLREQVEENRQAMQQRVDADRTARLAAERRLDDAMRQYELAIAAGNAADVDRLRRVVEDQEIALRIIQERETANEQAMAAQVDALKTDIQNIQTSNPALAAQRQADLLRQQAELDQLRRERQTDLSARADIQRRHEQAVADAQKQRQQADAQTQAMRQQVEQAQQAAQQAAQQLEESQKKAQQEAQQTQQQLQAAQQQAQQSASEAEKARQAAAAAQAELEKTRQELARREEEARQLRMQQELARIAATKAESRGIVVTLPGIFFDPGKSQLKAGAKKTLGRIAEQLKTDNAIRISIEGHTDSTGKPEKNMAISEKRAQAVREYLVSQGVPADRIVASGKGDAEPVATNKTVAGRQQNRRVELVITR